MSEPDEVEGLKRALREAREAGDISIEEFLEELKKLRPQHGSSSASGSRALAPEAAEPGHGSRRRRILESDSEEEFLVDETGRPYRSPRRSVNFALSPNSASCERVFSLLKQMFGDQQISTLADAIRAALMLRYNDRMVG